MGHIEQLGGGLRVENQPRFPSPRPYWKAVSDHGAPLIGLSVGETPVVTTRLGVLAVQGVYETTTITEPDGTPFAQEVNAFVSDIPAVVRVLSAEGYVLQRKQLRVGNLDPVEE